jgi:superfamily II DNA/RNA helicase
MSSHNLKHRMSASGDHDVKLRRVRRTTEPEFKTADDAALDVPWRELPVSSEVHRSMDNVFHFSHATFVQSQTVPVLLKPHSNAVVEAATGSGKTLAFLVPLLERATRLNAAHLAATGRPLLTRQIVGAVISPSRVLSQQTFVVARSLVCRVPNVLRFVLCDTSLEPLPKIIGHLRRASRTAAVVLVSSPKDFDMVRHALADPLFLDDSMTGATAVGADGDDEDMAAAMAAAVAKKKARMERQAAAAGEKKAAPGGDVAASDVPTGDDKPRLVCGVGAEPPFLLVLDEADVVLRTSAMYESLTAFVTEMRAQHTTVPAPPAAKKPAAKKGKKQAVAEAPAAAKSPFDIAVVGATVNSAPEVQAFLEFAGVSEADGAASPLTRIVVGSSEDFVSKLENKYILTRAGDMLHTLVHIINQHTTKKHFIFFNSPSVLLYIKALLAKLTENIHPLLHVTDLFALHEKMADAAKFTEFGKFLRHQCGEKAKGGAVMLCTDVAAFGLDVRDVDYVYHFEAPTTERSYIHRIGRVARMGMRGSSILLLPMDTSVEGAALRLKEYIEKLTAAHHMTCVNVPAYSAPITAPIRSLVARNKVLHALALKALPDLVGAEQSWFDEETGNKALCGIINVESETHQTRTPFYRRF